jgi:hypothetical protein
MAATNSGLDFRWSDDARVMLRPFRAYEELAALGAGDRAPRAAVVRELAVRVGMVLLTLAGFVSLTAAGRLVAFHVASTMIVWSFVPGIQALTFALAIRVVAPDLARPSRLLPALALYFTGHGPWLCFLLLLAAVCLFAPDVYGALMWLLSSRVLPAMFLAAIAWCGLLTFACFRAGLGLSRGRAVAATSVFYLAFSGAIIGYYLAMNEIQPQAPWAQR